MNDVKKPDRLTRSLDLFREMRLLALRQRGLVTDQEDFELTHFLDLAAQREHLQNEIAAETTQQMASEASVMGPSRKATSVPLAAEITEVIRSIKEIDRQIQESFSERRDALHLEIKNIRQGRNAMRGYGAKTPKRPRFIDKEG